MKRVAVLGMPNTGKSTLFNRLTGAGAHVGNWPGVTVDLLSAKLLLGDAMVEVVDLPGFYNLHGFSEDEQVVRRFLETQPVNLLLVVLNSCQLDRQLALPLQLKELGVPMVILLNMTDEAGRLGIRIDAGKLEAALGGPVRALSAKFGQGLVEVKDVLTQQLREHPKLSQAKPAAFDQDVRIEQELDALVSASVASPIHLPPSATDKLDRVLLHPWLGLPIFFLMMFLLFQAIYGLGSPLQDAMSWLLDHIKTDAVEPFTAAWPAALRSLAVDGLFDGIGTVLTFLPIIAVFFMLMAIIEDSGYLARAAFLTDALMSRLGLDGRAFVMQLMGFGCNVPAIMGTRIMRSSGLRALTMLIIPFSLCSARLQVMVFVIAAVFSPRMAPVALFTLYLTSFVAAFLTAFLFRKRYHSHEPLLLELPPYRLPTWRFLGVESWRAVKQFLAGAGGFIVVGVLLVWFMTHFPFDAAPAGPDTLAGGLAELMRPIFAPLGIDALLSIALLFGFVAKEIVIGALAVIYGVGPDQLSGVLTARLDWVQAYSFLIFTLIYTPCLSTVAAIRSESKSWRLALLATAWPLTLAWAASFLFYQAARALT
ncbi:ferrous iron transport protein B [Parasulfuritortus cantonensis]|uniref:Ferrous iron transport protein B n=1 Tax=Parasulfuritortus cantonensis TaxID=2528202 RepID=A0A4R1BQB3_9PROT|nr:ferrous iron transport protein B [Parasulfuritortus cantonensis]TCJ19771.1 ferrous iron transport protein B [Parasulfuritortus cantonensis]